MTKNICKTCKYEYKSAGKNGRGTVYVKTCPKCYEKKIDVSDWSMRKFNRFMNKLMRYP